MQITFGSLKDDYVGFTEDFYIPVKTPRSLVEIQVDKIRRNMEGIEVFRPFKEWETLLSSLLVSIVLTGVVAIAAQL